jgi:hypothetical protein
MVDDRARVRERLATYITHVVVFRDVLFHYVIRQGRLLRENYFA